MIKHAPIYNEKIKNSFEWNRDERIGSKICGMCNNVVNDDCCKKSEHTGEWYCTEGLNNCWDLVAAESEKEEIEAGNVNYHFK